MTRVVLRERPTEAKESTDSLDPLLVLKKAAEWAGLMTEVGATVRGKKAPSVGGEGTIVEKMDDRLKGSSTGARGGLRYVKPSIVRTHERVA